jgi:hypothetical protein
MMVLMVRKKYLAIVLIFVCAGLVNCVSIFAQSKSGLELSNDHIRIGWKKTSKGWQISQLSVRKGQQWIEAANPTGENTFLYSAEMPGKTPDTTFQTITGVNFPEPIYKYQVRQWAESTNPISLNTAGKAYHFFPGEGIKSDNNSIQFKHNTDVGLVTTEWSIDPAFPTDIIVKQTLTVKSPGYFSLASPTLAPVSESNLSWATVPGYFQGNKMQKNFALAYAYGHGIPTLPVVYRERSASTLCPIITTKNGITYSVIPEPGLARDPWAKDTNTHANWFLGLSHKNRKSELTPTIYYPVLGEPRSSLKAGEEISYNFRYSLSSGDWYKALTHAIYDIYKFKESVNMRQNRQSLTARIEEMHHYLTDPVTSMWNVEDYMNLKIGAQSYLGGVVGSDKDAMKNSDYGAMWMLAYATQDSLLTRNRLPYALNFKLTQQQTEDGFFKGAAVGQYYLAKKKKFVEEWGEVVEPIALTYYTMLDVGNMLLFEPANTVLKDRLRIGAESLLKWQKPDGSWAVAYDRHTEQEIYKDIKDLRPTFYGLIVAYRILKDEKYLAAAKKGADWLIKEAVATGSYLGVCGDARYAPDFATGQSAQAFLDLFEITKNQSYKDAAIATARIYTASVYTHPVASHQKKMVNGIEREDWEITQSGLSFEHGGIFGSSNSNGPITLASHAGLFVRMYQITKDTLFLDMARSAAIGREGFNDPATSVASYYWRAMNKGAGPYPHHAWWQIGWITDYLLSEANMRSGGQVAFPKGFVTPKVGPHQTYGFENGKIFGEAVKLTTTEAVVTCDKPQVEYLVGRSPDNKKLYVVLMNNSSASSSGSLSWGEKATSFKTIVIKDQTGKTISKGNTNPNTAIQLEPFGLKVLVLEQ